MSYLRKLLPVLAIAVTTGVVSGYVGLYTLGWVLLAVSAAAGIILAACQKETVSYRFLDKLALGSLVHGAVSVALIIVRIYFASREFYVGRPNSFLDSLNLWDQLWLALALAFAAFMGGLVGIVGKGFYTLSRVSRPNL